MPTNCSVKYCNSKQGFKFPKNEKRSKLWANILNIEVSAIKKHSHVCKKHFKDSDFVKVSYYTDLALTKNILTKTAVPSLDLGINNENLSKTNSLSDNENIKAENFGDMDIESNVNVNLIPFKNFDINHIKKSLEALKTKNDYEKHSTQGTSISDLNVTFAKYTQTNNQTRNVSTQTLPYGILSYEIIKKKKGALYYYTGFDDTEMFELVLGTLEPTVHDLNYFYYQVNNVSIIDQFLITLIKLKRGTPDFELALLFSISKNAVQNIFQTWIHFMDFTWSKLGVCPDKFFVTKHIPNSIKKMLTSTSENGTDTPLQVAGGSHLHKETVKNNTLNNPNILSKNVKSTPSCSINKVSSATNESTSNQMIQTSKEPMIADKEKLQLMLGKLSEKNVNIEKIIGLTKTTYKILKNTLSKYYVSHGDKIFYVCCTLCNFRYGIKST